MITKCKTAIAPIRSPMCLHELFGHHLTHEAKGHKLQKINTYL